MVVNGIQYRVRTGVPWRGLPERFGSWKYKRRNEVERTINQLKHARAVATRYDTRTYVFHGIVTVTSIRLWLKS